MTQQVETPVAANTETMQKFERMCDPALIPGRDSAQIICRIESAGVLESFELLGGPNGEVPPSHVRVYRVAVGARVFPANLNGHDVGRWEDAIGQLAPAQSFLVVTVLNEGADPVVVTGKCTFRAQAGQAPPANPSQTSQSAGTASFQPAPSAAVVPANLPRAGANEVWVPLTRESVRRLWESLTGRGMAISPYEAGDIVRRLESAMRQP